MVQHLTSSQGAQADSPLGALAGVLGGLGAVMAKMSAAVLPAMYQRTNYTVACLYVLGGDSGAAKKPKGAARRSGGQPKGPSLSGAYLGVGGMFFAVGPELSPDTLSDAGGMQAEAAADAAGEADDDVGVGMHVGGDRDEHGCIGSAGYQWCGSRGKCLRPWEDECPDWQHTDSDAADSPDAADSVGLDSEEGEPAAEDGVQDEDADGEDLGVPSDEQPGAEDL